MREREFEIRDARARRGGRNTRIAIIQERDEAGVEVLLKGGKDAVNNDFASKGSSKGYSSHESDNEGAEGRYYFRGIPKRLDSQNTTQLKGKEVERVASSEGRIRGSRRTVETFPDSGSVLRRDPSLVIFQRTATLCTSDTGSLSKGSLDS
jgi:hypothetical protein